MVLRVYLTNIERGGEREENGKGIYYWSMWEWGLLQEYFRVRHVFNFAPPMKTESGAAISNKELMFLNNLNKGKK